ncbi:MAG: nucleotidyltransferase domain-containing protein, partial [Candidatus Thermoplasmatota archaeon]
MARASVRRAALQTAKGIARDLAAEGAEAVVLMGSWVRGDAHRESDLDVDAIGQGPFYRLERRGPFLVAVSWRTAAAWRRTFRDPASVGGAILGWRCARILHDPRGVARALKDDARGWTWASLGDRADAWVAEELAGYAEEVHKLVANLALRTGKRIDWSA